MCEFRYLSEAGGVGDSCKTSDLSAGNQLESCLRAACTLSYTTVSLVQTMFLIEDSVGEK